MKILVTGATGYIGGRLIPRFIEEGHDVRILVRDPRRIVGRSWEKRVEVFSGDLLDASTLTDLFKDIDVAYYLVHSMYAYGDFRELDQKAVSNFIGEATSSSSQLKHCIYLGGLSHGSKTKSDHLQSRLLIGEKLRNSLPTTEFRAGPIIGSGSASFEMVRYLTERLPVMIAPRWVMNAVQPIAIRDILSYLVDSLEISPQGIIEVGAPAVTFKEMMQIYASTRGYRRIIIPVPVLAPWLAARWVGLVTPVPNRLAIPLVEGVIKPVLADTTRAKEVFPNMTPLPYKSSVEFALEKVQKGIIETHWSGALGSYANAVELSDWEGTITETRRVQTNASTEETFNAFTSLGGKEGWLVWTWAWELRGLLDRLVGGPGLRRGRRHSQELLEGEALDFWRVEKIIPGKLMRLRAEMKVPGKAWLQYDVSPHEDDSGSLLTQTAFFQPSGLGGALYWYILYPMHGYIFSDMAKAVARKAEAQTER